MSYRLIDANAIAALWPEVNDMPCIYADLPRGLDGGHYDMREPSELQRENTKLRELALRFRNHTAKCTNYTYNFGYGDCALGPFPDGGGCGNCRHVMCGDMYRDDLDKQLRELGIEVE